MQALSKMAVRLCASGLAATLTLGAAAQTAAQPYPSKPIKILVGVPPGGSTDGLARLFAERLQQSMGQATIVDNKPGANTAVAADAVARAPADGYTLLVASDAFITVPLLAKVSFDPFRDFAPIGTVAANHFVMAVHPSVPVNSVKELIAYAKARPGRMNYGSSGNGGVSHLGVENFKLLTDTRIVHIPYRGAGPALTDAVAGQYELSVWTPFAISSHVAAGKLKPLAVTGQKRISGLPHVPTFAEAGLPAFDMRSWLAVYAPAGTPKAIVDQLSNEIQKMLATPRMKEVLDKQGVEPFFSTPDQLTALMRKDIPALEKLIKSAHITMD